jgi:hypothetical protein
MRAARLQSNDLGRADTFFGSLLSKDDIKMNEKAPILEHAKVPQINGSSLPFRTDAKPRFSDPPAPPPQQPLPEKPDVARSHTSETPSLKRSNTERPRSVTSVSPVRQEPTSQIITLVEALASAKKEIDTQSARMRDLEEMLQKERQAREVAEELAKRLELQSETKVNGHAKTSTGVSVMEEAFEPPSESVDAKEVDSALGSTSAEPTVDPKALSESTLLLEKRIESMLVDMQELRQQMEAFKARAETAEFERDAGRRSLAEMVEKIRAEESARKSASSELATSPISEENALGHVLDGESDDSKAVLLEGIASSNGNAVGPGSEKELEITTVGTLAKAQPSHDHLLYHTTPYASMLGVVLIGMGLMAYLNGWQPPKVDP